MGGGLEVRRPNFWIRPLLEAQLDRAEDPAADHVVGGRIGARLDVRSIDFRSLVEGVVHAQLQLDIVGDSPGAGEVPVPEGADAGELGLARLLQDPAGDGDER